MPVTIKLGEPRRVRVTRRPRLTRYKLKRLFRFSAGGLAVGSLACHILLRAAQPIKTFASRGGDVTFDIQMPPFAGALVWLCPMLLVLSVAGAVALGHWHWRLQLRAPAVAVALAAALALASVNQKMLANTTAAVRRGCYDTAVVPRSLPHTRAAPSYSANVNGNDRVGSENILPIGQSTM